jgi:hypothetical protein
MTEQEAQERLLQLRKEQESLETWLAALKKESEQPKRQENDDVFEGFRGNNDYA